jgi:hypothetical protein
MRTLPLLLTVSLAAAPAALAGPEHDHGTTAKKKKKATTPFGPWDAGKRRDVDRQGKRGEARAPHPFFGEAAKVPASGPPPPPFRRDPDMPERTRPANKRASGLSANPLYLAALTYSQFLTKLDGPRCQHYPTCSRFANQAVAKHGVLGIFMGLDRLIQDGNSSMLRALPQLEMPGGNPRHFDPVENYEFWREDTQKAFPSATAEEPLELTELPSTRRARKSFTRCTTDRSIPPPSDVAEEEDGCAQAGS